MSITLAGIVISVILLLPNIYFEIFVNLLVRVTAKSLVYLSSIAKRPQFQEPGTRVLDKDGGEIELSNLGEEDIEPMNIVAPAEDQVSDEDKALEEDYYEEESYEDEFYAEEDFPEDYNESEINEYDDFDE